MFFLFLLIRPPDSVPDAHTHTQGARYKFGVNVQSKGFDEAPDAILRALHRMVWAGQRAVKSTSEVMACQDGGGGPYAPPAGTNEFNELLALGFMEDDRINYHDDGEKELGPTVAALSLGSPSTMKFRPKIRSGFGDAVPKRPSGRAYQDVLEVPFKHGDMMVMHGGLIHRLYEVRCPHSHALGLTVFALMPPFFFFPSVKVSCWIADVAPCSNSSMRSSRWDVAGFP